MFLDEQFLSAAGTVVTPGAVCVDTACTEELSTA